VSWTSQRSHASMCALRDESTSAAAILALSRSSGSTRNDVAGQRCLLGTEIILS